jgi:hypothetical protein
MTSTLIATSETTLFTASGAQAVPNLTITNVENAACTVTVYVKATAGTSAGDVNTLIAAYPMLAYETISITKDIGAILLADLQVITALKTGTTNKATAFVSSVAL